MTADDDETRRLRAELDAAIGHTPVTPNRMTALSARYQSSRRRHAVVAATASAAVVATIVGGAVALAAGPGRSGHQFSNNVAISPTQLASSALLMNPNLTNAARPTSAPAGPTSADTSAPPLQVPPPLAAASASTASAPPTPHGLRGTVVDETGRPLRGIYVTGFDGATRTDANGRFVAPSTAGRHGGCLLFSSQPLATPQSGPPTAGDFSWQQWTAPSGDCTEEVNADIRITMHPGADVFGTVHDSNGSVVAGVAVYSTVGPDGRIFLSSSCCGASFAAVTDSGGHYRIYGQQAGRTMMALRQPWYLGGAGGVGTPATAGTGAPTDLVDDTVPPASAGPPVTSPSP